MYSVAANLIARFILDLRSILNKEPVQASHVSTLEFGGAHDLADNMGAPLSADESTWVASAADDAADYQEEQDEEEAAPFPAGLGLDEQEIGLERVPYVSFALCVRLGR